MHLSINIDKITMISPFSNPTYSNHISDCFKVKINTKQQPYPSTTNTSLLPPSPRKKNIIILPRQITLLKKQMDVAEQNHRSTVHIMCNERTEESMKRASAAFRDFEARRREFALAFNTFKKEIKKHVDSSDEQR